MLMLSIRIAFMPRWQRAALCAGQTVLIAAGFLVLMRIEGYVWFASPAVIAVTTCAALLFGAVCGVFAGRSSQLIRYREALSSLDSPAQRSAAITALWHGPIPTDPEIHAATKKLAAQYLRTFVSRASIGSVSICATAVVLLAISAVVAALRDLGDAARPGALALYFGTFTAWNWYAPRRISRRLTELGATAPGPWQRRNAIRAGNCGEVTESSQ